MPKKITTPKPIRILLSYQMSFRPSIRHRYFTDNYIFPAVARRLCCGRSVGVRVRMYVSGLCFLFNRNITNTARTHNRRRSTMRLSNDKNACGQKIAEQHTHTRINQYFHPYIFEFYERGGHRRCAFTFSIGPAEGKTTPPLWIAPLRERSPGARVRACSSSKSSVGTEHARYGQTQAVATRHGVYITHARCSINTHFENTCTRHVAAKQYSRCYYPLVFTYNYTQKKTIIVFSFNQRMHKRHGTRTHARTCMSYRRTDIVVGNQGEIKRNNIHRKIAQQKIHYIMCGCST